MSTQQVDNLTFFSLVARQQHIRTEWDDFYIDLVFYNYILRCFVLIDLKASRITHQDVGQMDMYVRMYDEFRRNEGDGPTLGLVLCAETDEDIARYSVMRGSEQLFMSKYKLYLPPPRRGGTARGDRGPETRVSGAARR